MVESLMEIMRLPGANEILGIIGIALGILGFIFGFIFYFKAKKEKIPLYTIKTTNLISGYSNVISKLNVTFSGQQVENLSVSKIAFWNSGKDTIKRSDIAPTDLLRIEIGNYASILDASIVKVVKDANAIALGNITPEKVELAFDYLDFDEGFIVQIVHTGTHSDDLILKGSLMGAKSIAKREISALAYPFTQITHGRQTKLKKKGSRVALGVFLVFAGVTLIAGAIFSDSELSSKANQNIMRVVGISAALLYFYMAYSLFSSFLPKKLKTEFVDSKF